MEYHGPNKEVSALKQSECSRLFGATDSRESVGERIKSSVANEVDQCQAFRCWWFLTNVD